MDFVVPLRIIVIPSLFNLPFFQDPGRSPIPKSTGTCCRFSSIYDTEGRMGLPLANTPPNQPQRQNVPSVSVSGKWCRPANHPPMPCAFCTKS